MRGITRGKILIAFSFFVFLVMVQISFAADCGGGYGDCDCGDTLTTSHTMTYNITDCGGHGLVIGSSSITLDCDGHTIDGTNAFGKYGPYMNNKNNVTIKNCNIQEFSEVYPDRDIRIVE